MSQSSCISNVGSACTFSSSLANCHSMAFPGGFGEYMRSKRQKQKAQIKREQESSIFSNLKLYFNGYTGSMTMLDLKKLVSSHGAQVMENFTANVDFIIASQM